MSPSVTTATSAFSVLAPSAAAFNTTSPSRAWKPAELITYNASASFSLDVPVWPISFSTPRMSPPRFFWSSPPEVTSLLMFCWKSPAIFTDAAPIATAPAATARPPIWAPLLSAEK